jgi:hypothetical protein
MRQGGESNMLFETNPIDLSELMAKVLDLRIQLPDFHRLSAFNGYARLSARCDDDAGDRRLRYPV